MPLGGVCWDEGYIPLGGLDKTLVVNDVLYSYRSIGRAKKIIVLVVDPVNR